MILLVGATGTLGGIIARDLLARSVPVRVLVREKSEYAPLVEMGAQPVFGDLKDPRSLEPACDGVDVVLTTANSVLRGGSDTVESVDRTGNRNLIDAAKRAGSVGQFIFVSAYGVSVDSPVPFVAAKAQTERYLGTSGLTYTVLQPNIFMDVWLPAVIGGPVAAGAPVTLVGEGRRRHSFVAIRDVAAYAVAVLGNERAWNQTIAIGGAAPITWHDAVAAYGQMLGRTLPVRTVAPGQPVPGLPDAMLGLLTTMEYYDSPIDMSQTSRLYGIPATSVDEWVRSQPVGHQDTALAAATRG